MTTRQRQPTARQRQIAIDVLEQDFGPLCSDAHYEPDCPSCQARRLSEALASLVADEKGE
jgi:hypothetical protein